MNLLALATAALALAHPASAQPLVVRGGLGHLVMTTDRAMLGYTVYSGSKVVRGTLYVRNNRQKAYSRIALTRKNNFRVRVPNRLIRGKRLFYYSVFTDPRTHKKVRLPASGRATTWILNTPVVVKLGSHQFGQTRAPEAVVARASADQVGIEPPNPYEFLPGFGPQTFLVNPDGSIWLHDSLNSRLLVWDAGHPDTIARTVKLPFFARENDIAFGPGGSIYVTRVLRDPPKARLVLDRLSSTGAVIWQRPLGGEYFGNSTLVLGANSPLRTGPDGTLYILAFMGLPGDEWAWMPVATPQGKAIAPAAQRTRTSWPFQPFASGLRLLGGEIYTPRDDTAPHELRYALVDRRDRVVRSWRILSRSEMNFHLTVPERAGGDPVVVVDFLDAPRNSWEYEVLRLGPHGARADFSLAHSTFGSDVLPDLRLGPDGELYQLATSVKDGVAISRYSLEANK